MKKKDMIYIILAIGMLFSIFLIDIRLNPHNPHIDIPICIESHYQGNPQIISDGSGGAIIAWEDWREGGCNIFIQKISLHKSILWTLNGMNITNSNYFGRNHKIISDGEGGVLIFWEDQRKDSYSDIYAQRIDKDGNLKWIKNGIPICTAQSFQGDLHLYRNEYNKIFVIWEDCRNGPTDIYAQLIDVNGNILWKENGLIICNASSYQENPRVCGDNSGGSIIIWEDKRNGISNIYAQRFDSNGTMCWKENGIQIHNSFYPQYSSQICNDREGGAIIIWEEERPKDINIFAQKIDKNGIIQWNHSGIAIISLVHDKINPVLCFDGFGGAIIAWTDLRTEIESDIYAQRIDSEGNRKWSYDGIPVCTSLDNQYNVQICDDEQGGAFLIWENNFYNEPDVCISAQHIDFNGINLWKEDGIKISSSKKSQTNPQICKDGDGNAIIVWESIIDNDYYFEINFDIFAQFI